MFLAGPDVEEVGVAWWATVLEDSWSPSQASFWLNEDRRGLQSMMADLQGFVAGHSSRGPRTVKASGKPRRWKFGTS